MTDTDSQKPKRVIPLLQPLTFGGVARFANERVGRLMLAQFLFALGASACVVAMMLTLMWCPVVDKVIKSLPDNGAILNGELQWPEGAGLAAEEIVFGLAIDPGESGTAGLTADQRVVLGKKGITLSGLLGFVEIDYPQDRFLPVNRQALTPAWGAWQPALLAGAGLGTLVAVWSSWVALATLYCLPIRLIALIARREATLFSCWKLGSAALLPGSLVMSGAILLYTLSPLPLVGLGLGFALHFATGWIYVVFAPLKLPKLARTGPTPANPFVPTPEPEAEPAVSKKPKNPFAGEPRKDRKS